MYDITAMPLLIIIYFFSERSAVCTYMKQNYHVYLLQMNVLCTVVAIANLKGTYAHLYI